MQASWKGMALSLLAMVFLCGVSRADDTRTPQWDQQVTSAIAALNRFTPQQLRDVSREEAVEVVEAFQQGLQAIETVVASPLPEADKAVLVAQIADAAGGAFELLTAPYENPVEAPLAWEALKEKYASENMFLRSCRWVGHRISWVSQIVARDFMRAVPIGKDDHGKWRAMWPYVFPFMGSDRNRSVAAVEATSAITTALEKQLADANSADFLVVGALQRVIASMKTAEPMRFSRFHEAARRVYFGLAVFTFLHPPLEPFLERTTYSPLVSAVLWSGAALYGARVRRQDSGLDAAWDLKKMEKRIAKDPNKHAALNSCSRRFAQLAGAPAP